MIHSAQVFSPRPSNDPRENLRILQSPVKKPSSPIKNSSPLKMAILPDIEEEEIVLVHTNHPRVVEEDKDLVILEDVPLQLLSPVMITPRQTNQFPVLQTQQPPCTPRRKSLGGTALHRAVLIRSAQRAVLKAEKEREDEEEELEVLGTVVGTDDEDLAKRKIEPVEEEDVEMLDVDDENEETDDEDDDGDLEEQTQKSLWRKSLEKIIPWSLGGSVTETEVGILLPLLIYANLWFRSMVGEKTKWKDTSQKNLWNHFHRSNLPPIFQELSLHLNHHVIPPKMCKAQDLW